MVPEYRQIYMDWTIKAGICMDEKDFEKLLDPILHHIKIIKRVDPKGFIILNFKTNCFGPDDRLYLLHELLRRGLPRNFYIVITPLGEVFISAGNQKFFDINETNKHLGVGEKEIVFIKATPKKNGKLTSLFFFTSGGQIHYIVASKNRAYVLNWLETPDHTNKAEFEEFCRRSGMDNNIPISMTEAWLKIMKAPGFNLEAAIALCEQGNTIIAENCDCHHVVYEKENQNFVFGLFKNGVPMDFDDAIGILGPIGFPLVPCINLSATKGIKELMSISELAKAGFDVNSITEGLVVTIGYSDGTFFKVKYKYAIYILLL
jgi:hypothetical protein